MSELLDMSNYLYLVVSVILLASIYEDNVNYYIY
jgi:hypothetical protein